MGDPRWHDPAPRPPYHGGPQPYWRPSAAGHGAGRPDDDRPDDDRAAPASRRAPRWGALPARTGILLLIGAVALGAVSTIVAGSQPGFVLGAFLVTGTAAAAFAVRPRVVYRIIPVPALAYVAACLITVPVSGPRAGSSATALALGIVQALASGFLVIIVATGLAVAVTVARGRRNSPARRGPGHRAPGRPAGTGIRTRPQPPAHSGRPSRRRPPSPRRPGLPGAMRGHGRGAQPMCGYR